MRFAITLFLCFFSLSCSAANVVTDNLIRPWSKELQKEEPYKYPFVAAYKKGEFNLRFIAAKHANNINSTTFKIIKKEIKTKPIDLIIIESIPYETGPSPQYFLDHAKKCHETNFSHCSEAAYTIWLNTKKDQSPFVGGEPTDHAILQYMTKKGFKEHDIAYFYLLRKIPQLKRQGRLKVNYTEQFKQHIQRIVRRLSLNEELTLSGFLHWYTKHIKKKFLIEDITTHYVAPYNDQKSIFSQKISHAISLYRDKFIVNLIRKKSKKFKSILIVYGGSHHTKQKLALEYLFGPTKFRKEL